MFKYILKHIDALILHISNHMNNVSFILSTNTLLITLVLPTPDVSPKSHNLPVSKAVFLKGDLGQIQERAKDFVCLFEMIFVFFGCCCCCCCRRRRRRRRCCRCCRCRRCRCCVWVPGPFFGKAPEIQAGNAGRSRDVIAQSMNSKSIKPLRKRQRSAPN